ncbi:MAG: anaerobic glycerol-3-phosphate dehydrogenase subunit C [Candidatus Korobacteraceae bacterium]
MQVDDLKLDYCVKCSDCNAACSVSKVYPDYPGPKALGPDMERFRREGVASDTKWVEYCLGCHRCDLACPHGVNVSELIAKGKAEHEKVGLRGLRDRLLARPSVLGKLGSSTAPVSNAILGLKLNRWLMSSLVEITAKRSFPAYSSKPIQPASGDQTAGLKAVFFPGCFIRYNNPEVGRMVVDLLRLNGFAVEVSAARCCGMPAMANGEKAELLSAVEENVAEMVRAVDQGACIVTACTSCGYALKGDYSHLLEGNSAHAESAQKVSSATFDLAELLTGLLDEGKLNTSFRPLNLKLAYHAPCHLKSQGIGRPWLRLLRAVPGIEIEEIKADCCGMAGTYGFKNEKYPISMDIGRDLFEGIRAYNPQSVITECGSCQMQIEHGTQLRALHPAEILHAAYQPTA